MSTLISPTTEHDTTRGDHDTMLLDAVREGAARAAVAVGLVGLAVIHALDSVGKWSEVRYIFWMYMAACAGALVVGGWVLFTRSCLSLLAAAGLSASVLAGFIVNRTVGMPNATDDIGNWTEPLGLASMIIEASTIAVALVALRLSTGRRRR